jgi:signal transduction histidine kinase
MHLTTRTKITILFTLLVAGILALLDVIIFQTADHAWQTQKQAYVAKVMHAMYTPDQAKKELEHVEIRDASGVILHQQGVFALGSGVTHSDDIFGLSTDTITTGTQSYITASESKMGVTITTAEDITEQVAMRDDTIRTAFWTSLVGIMVVALIGHFFSGYILAPMRQMHRVAEGFSLRKKETEHHTRIRGHARDEVVLLARSLESLFTRVRSEAAKLEQFSDDMAHEIKNTLFSIQSSLDVALHTEHRDIGIARARNTIQELSKVVDALLFFSRNETGNMTKTNITKLIASHIDESDTRISITGDEDIEHEIYPELWMTALGNIISNAQKFTPSGGKITIDISRDGVTIRDTGVGIADTDMPHIFDRLYKADTARSHGTGYGLGLAIARRIIEDLHHQTLTVESEEWEGTEFRIGWGK